MGRKINYEGYVELYKEQARKLAERYGYSMHSPMLSEAQYRANYKATRNTLKKQGKSIGHIKEQIVAKQSFLVSRTSAKTIAEARKRLGMTDDMTLVQIRKLGRDAIDWEAVKNDYSLYKIESIDDPEGVLDYQSYVSKYVFGSEI